MKKIIITLSVLWALIVLFIFMYGRLTGDQPSKDLNPGFEDIDAPYIGKPLSDFGSPKDIVTEFIKKINEGNYEEAIYYIDPNYYYNNLSSDEFSYEIVNLWEPGEMKNYSIFIPSVNASPLLCSFTITLQNGKKSTYKFEIIELINSEAVPIVKDNYITNIYKEDHID
ncbi:hypothetical protein [Paenibacillus sp. IITD108]|uniref:hypothetical protein n=1 Tax=Paenibacillus sp. IITD108 TaxID=3116649 RepID=UPI002F3F2BB4